MLDRTWENFKPQRWRENSDKMWPPRRAETIQEVEQLREAERKIATTTGWNSSTMVIGHLLRRLRGESDEA